MIKKILVITDSLGLPRTKPQECKYEDTWPVLLKNKTDVQVHQVSIGGATVTELYEQLMGYHISFNPNVIIVQAGIVDCAPRAFTKFEISFLTKYKISAYLLKIITRRYSSFLRRLRGITYTKPQVFKKIVERISDLKKEGIEIYWIGIAPSNLEYEKKVPNITKNISIFNNIIENRFHKEFISIDNIPNTGIMSDHFHLNKVGNEYVFNCIMKQSNA